MDNKEIFKTLKENTNYSISNFGNIKNNKTGKLVKCYIPSKNNYVRCDLDSSPRVNLNVEKTVVRYFDHIIDGLKFDVIHLDGDALNCRLDNLQVKYKVNRDNVDKLVAKVQEYQDVDKHLKALIDCINKLL